MCLSRFNRIIAAMPFDGSIRPRRLRQQPQLRAMLSRVTLRRSDVIVPIFVRDGKKLRKEVPSMPESNGVKQRIRWRLADQGDWPIDVALYGEISESDVEVELEAKIILERRFGRLRILANAWVEHEFYYTGRREWVFNPTFGMTYQVTPMVFPGIEYWMRAEVLSQDDGTGGGDFNAGPHHYVGPTLRLSFGNFFWTTGLYLRASNVGRNLTPGVDAFGPIWFRTIAGFGF